MERLSWRELARITAALARPVTGVETLSLHAISGRIAAEDIRAVLPLPRVSHAVMDGYALGSVPPGTYRLRPEVTETLALDEAAPVSTGAPTPRGAAAVVLAEKATRDDGMLRITQPQVKDNIRRAGEEARPGDVIIRTGVRLDARHAALAAAAGVPTAVVRKAPRVALLSVAEGDGPSPHAAVMAALLGSAGLRLTECGVTRPERLAGELGRAAARHDLVVVTGDSLGDESGALALAISGAAGEVRVRRAALKPAKPVVMGHAGQAVVIGFSGTAYAVAAAAHLFLRPLLLTLAGRAVDDPVLPALAAFDRPRHPGRAEALPVTAAWHDGRLTLSTAGRFGQLSALAALDGFALIESDAGDVAPGAACLYHPLLLPLV